MKLLCVTALFFLLAGCAGITEADIKHDLMENSPIILDILGGEEIIWNEIYIQAGTPPHVRAQIQIGIMYGERLVHINSHILLSYANGWVLTAYELHGRLREPGGQTKPESQPQPLEEMETVTVKFYRYVFCPEGIESLQYIPVEIPGENWREKIPQLMLRHSGVHVRGLWYEGTRLFVDLYPAPAIFFDWGSLGGYAMTTALVESLATLPYVEEILVLVDGKPGYYGSHFDFSRVFRVNRN